MAPTDTRTAVCASTHTPIPLNVDQQLRIALQTLADIAGARGAFGVDPAQDMAWMQKEAGRTLDTIVGQTRPGTFGDIWTVAP